MKSVTVNDVRKREIVCMCDEEVAFASRKRKKEIKRMKQSHSVSEARKETVNVAIKEVAG